MKLIIDTSEELYANCINMGIKTNEQKAIAHGTPIDYVIEDIKAEIEEQVLESLSDGGDDWFAAEKVNECLEIIDKYKAEMGNEK